MYALISSNCSLTLQIDYSGAKKVAGRRSLLAAPPRLGPNLLIYLANFAYGAAFTIAWVVKKSLSTAPMLMYQHSRSGVFCPGR